jgi:putative two-component system response regulator
MTRKEFTLLIVDDQKENIQILASALENEYSIRFALNGRSALSLLQQEQVDLILLDVMMPEMDGFNVCRELKKNPETSDIPVIFVTALAELSDEAEGFAVGAVDYLIKPVRPAIVKARVETHLTLHRQKKFLENLVNERTRELRLTRDVTIYGLAGLAETRDNETGQHIRRTQLYVELLARFVHTSTSYSDQLNDNLIELIAKSAPLHDIGKVGIPDSILLKPGKLTDSEFEKMKEHVIIGKEAIEKAEKAIGGSNQNSFLASARQIAFSHHEKWNGRGYPLGLKGENIPLAGRIMAICDVYDALISRRVYKEPFSHLKALQMITLEKGEHFDPVLVDALSQLSDKFLKIAKDNIDDPEDLVFLLEE